MARWIALVMLTEFMEQSTRYNFCEGGWFVPISAIYLGPLSYLFAEGDNYNDQDSVKSFIAANSGFS